MSNSKDSSTKIERDRLRIGIYIIALGLFVIAIAYVVLALQIASTTPNRRIWSELYETAFGVGYLLTSIGTVTIATSYKAFLSR